MLHIYLIHFKDKKEIYTNLHFFRNNPSNIPNIHLLQTLPSVSLDLKVGIQENFKPSPS